MKVRQKLTAVGACALASAAVLGGAAVTSHAMGDSPTPAKGTLTVMSMTSDSNGAIKCVYDDIDLPTPPVGGITSQLNTQTDGAVQGHAEAISVISGSGSVDADGKVAAGAVFVSSESVSSPDGKGSAPTFTVSGQIGTATGVAADGTLPPLPDGAVVLNSDDVRPGTAQECAALKPTTSGLPPVLTAP